MSSTLLIDHNFKAEQFTHRPFSLSKTERTLIKMSHGPLIASLYYWQGKYLSVCPRRKCTLGLKIKITYLYEERSSQSTNWGLVFLSTWFAYTKLACNHSYISFGQSYAKPKSCGITGAWKLKFDFIYSMLLWNSLQIHIDNNCRSKYFWFRFLSIFIKRIRTDTPKKSCFQK